MHILDGWVINYNSVMHILAGWVIEDKSSVHIFDMGTIEDKPYFCVRSSEIAYLFPLTHAIQAGH